MKYNPRFADSIASLPSFTESHPATPDYLCQGNLKVFNEIERQYDITVQLDVDKATELTYTGHFKRSKTPEEVLNLICHPFGFTFVKQENGNYKVSQN